MWDSDESCGNDECGVVMKKVVVVVKVERGEFITMDYHLHRPHHHLSLQPP